MQLSFPLPARPIAAVAAAALLAATVTVASVEPAGASAPQLQAVSQFLTGSAGATNLGTLAAPATAIGGVTNGDALAR